MSTKIKQNYDAPSCLVTGLDAQGVFCVSGELPTLTKEDAGIEWEDYL